jgi:hypothetical protein
MGLSNYNVYKNIFEIAYEEGQIETDIFGLKLSREEGGNFLYYGSFNEDILSEAIWVPTSINYHWVLLIL